MSVQSVRSVRSFASSEALFRSFEPAIASVAHSLMAKAHGRLERSELMSAGVEGMLQAAGHYDAATGQQFWTFAYPRVRGAMLDAIREATCPVVPAIDGDEAAGDHPSPEDQLEETRFGAAVHGALGQLSVAQRTMLRGLYFEDRSLFELAAWLGLSERSATRVHTRALGRLRTLLAQDWGYEPEHSPRGSRDTHDWIDVLLASDGSGEIELVDTWETDEAEAANGV